MLIKMEDVFDTDLIVFRFILKQECALVASMELLRSEENAATMEKSFQTEIAYQAQDHNLQFLDKLSVILSISLAVLAQIQF